MKPLPEVPYEFTTQVVTPFPVFPAHLQHVIEEFVRTAVSQEEKGLAKYGKAVDAMDPQHDWLGMAEEELVDGVKYLMAERRRRDAVLHSVIHELTETAKKHPWMEPEEVTETLTSAIQKLQGLYKPK